MLFSGQTQGQACRMWPVLLLPQLALGGSRIHWALLTWGGPMDFTQLLLFCLIAFCFNFSQLSRDCFPPWEHWYHLLVTLVRPLEIPWEKLTGITQGLEDSPCSYCSWLSLQGTFHTWIYKWLVSSKQLRVIGFIYWVSASCMLAAEVIPTCPRRTWNEKDRNRITCSQ